MSLTCVLGVSLGWLCQQSTGSGLSVVDRVAHGDIIAFSPYLLVSSLVYQSHCLFRVFFFLLSSFWSLQQMNVIFSLLSKPWNLQANVLVVLVALYTFSFVGQDESFKF